MFEQIYASTWHHPLFFWVVGAPWLVYFVHKALAPGVRRDARFLWISLVVFQIAILLDAWLTGAWSPLPASTAVGVTFVVLGDFRYFVLLERFSFPDRSARWAAGSLAVAFLVPVASLPAKWWWSGRPLFLTYELAFFVLAAVIRFRVLPRRSLDPTTRLWLERLTLFELVQYAGWAIADVIILLGADIGFLLRLIPNTMYYAAFVPFVWLVAPEESRS